MQQLPESVRKERLLLQCAGQMNLGSAARPKNDRAEDLEFVELNYQAGRLAMDQTCSSPAAYHYLVSRMRGKNTMTKNYY
jgi:hypothetical protein